MIDFDEIERQLTAARERKRDIELAKLREKLEAEQAAYMAYYDGVFDALRSVKRALERENA